MMLELFPEGFEERDASPGVELAAYTNAGGEERLWQVFGRASSVGVADDWHERWRDFHRPVQVGKVWIGPPWNTPPAGSVAVVIDPGRAFGTGGHATTRLCLGLVEQQPPTSFLDIGCGSGVLAIAAGLLGFRPLVAIDRDPQAVEAATANAARNQVDLDVRLLDATQAALPPSDLTVANVTYADVEQIGRRVRSPLFVTSGYVSAEFPSVPGYRRIKRVEAEGWAADLMRRDE